MNARVNEYAKSIISQFTAETQPLAFWVFDLQAVENAVARWRAAMPTVRPCFAIKCNPCPQLVKSLGTLGCGWDCATINEIKEVLKMGFPVEDIVFSQTYKPFNQLLEAEKLGIKNSTVDSIEEVEKMVKYAPNMGIIVRINADDQSAGFSLGDKFGLHPEEIEPVIAKIKELGGRMTGVHFHVGSDSHNAHAFHEALAKARATVALGEKYGFAPRHIDIGGGFSQTAPFEEFGAVIENAIKELQFPEGTVFMAEPGRYMASNSLHFVASLHGKRVRNINGKDVREYTCGDGYHGSLAHCMLFRKEIECHSLTKSEDGEMFPSIIYGPSCNGADRVASGDFPDMVQGQDWVIFPNIGAYSMSLAVNFNGFESRNHKIYELDGTQLKAPVQLPEDIVKYSIPALAGMPGQWTL